MSLSCFVAGIRRSSGVGAKGAKGGDGVWG